MAHPSLRRLRAALVTGLFTGAALLTGCDSADSPALSSAPDAARALAPSAGAPAGDVIPGEYIVVLKEAAGNQRARAADAAVAAVAQDLQQQTGARVQRTFRHALAGLAVTLDDAALQALRKDPRVEYIEPNRRVYAVGTQTNATWGLDRVDQRSGTNGTYVYNATGAGVTAYVIDTGIRTTHADFGGRATHGYDAVDNDFDTSDCNGHGTHVAGTVGGTTWGVAKGVALVGVRVLDCQGSGTTSGVIAGVDWVTANASGPSVANMSLGGGASSALDQAVQNSINAGIAYAVAAGNGDWLGRQQDACNSSPARVADAITIGATSSTDAKASWSNYGSCVDFFAPGVSITSAWYTDDNATNTISGTSMATPHVAGAAALYLEGDPNAGPQTVRDALYNATTKGIVTNSSTANNHLLYTYDFSGGGGTTNNPPSAGFSFTTSNLTVSFTDASTDTDGTITSWSWVFGDGGTSTTQNPTHTYAASGTYTVTLTVTDNDGATNSTSQSVSVSDGSTGGIALDGTGYKAKGRWTTDLAWSGATSTNVDIFRDGSRIVTTANDGAHTDQTSFRGSGSLTYRVCEAGTQTCSGDVTVSF